MAKRTPLPELRPVLAALALAAAALAAAQPPDVEAERDTVFLISNAVPAGPLPPMPAFGLSVVGADTGAVIQGKPYSADAVTTTVQQLADGNRITHRNEARIYRDSEGRTRREQTFAPPAFAPQPGTAPTLVTINDPVAGTTYVVDPSAETARRLPSFDVARAPIAGTRIVRELRAHVPAPPDAPPGATPDHTVIVERGVASVADEPGRFDWVIDNLSATGPANLPSLPAPLLAPAPTVLGELDLRTEDLGEQILQGVRAKGTRTVQTVPAGAIGNERPIEIVAERWHSPALEVDVLRRNSDPRTGETVYELVNIDRNEPPADLFVIPSGYEVAEGPGTFEFKLERTQ